MMSKFAEFLPEISFYRLEKNKNGDRRLLTNLQNIGALEAP
jgi:hypothetical protein